MKILSLSDKIIPFLYSPQIRQRFKDVDVVLACGDLAYYYLEYILNTLDVTLYYVRGNHDKVVEFSQEGHQRSHPHGAIDLHRKSVLYKGLLLAGVEGSLRYRPGSFQYSQAEMWQHVFSLVPKLLYNRFVYGRFLDIFITHAPPTGIHDQPDLTHQGIRAFRWLISTFQPRYHFHGHIHHYYPGKPVETLIGCTWVINSYGFRETEIEILSSKKRT